MDFRKVASILAAGIGVMILFFIIKAVFFKDELKPVLGNLVVLNQQLVSLGEEAQSNLENFDYQTTAANITNVVASDNTQLNKYYQGKYGKKLPKPAGTSPAQALKASPDGIEYDTKFRDLALELKDTGAGLAQQLLNASSSSQLNTLLESYLEHLEIVYEKL